MPGFNLNYFKDGLTPCYTKPFSTEYNILTGRKIGSPCTSIQTLSEEFRKIDLERVLQKIEIEIELATSNGKVIIAEDMSNENGFFHGLL